MKKATDQQPLQPALLQCAVRLQRIRAKINKERRRNNYNTPKLDKTRWDLENTLKNHGIPTKAAKLAAFIKSQQALLDAERDAKLASDADSNPSILNTLPERSQPRKEATARRSPRPQKKQLAGIHY